MTHYHVQATNTENGERLLGYEALGDAAGRYYETRGEAQQAADDLASDGEYVNVEYTVTDNCINADCEGR